MIQFSDIDASYAVRCINTNTPTRPTRARARALSLSLERVNLVVPLVIEVTDHACLVVFVDWVYVGVILCHLSQDLELCVICTHASHHHHIVIITHITSSSSVTSPSTLSCVSYAHMYISV